MSFIIPTYRCTFSDSVSCAMVCIIFSMRSVLSESSSEPFNDIRLSAFFARNFDFTSSLHERYTVSPMVSSIDLTFESAFANLRNI